MLDKEKGCLRFEYGKDWNKGMTEEQINHIGEVYSTTLDNKIQELENAKDI